jgi:predicted TIM-barrel fold metal-dependent hydrolase
MKIIDTHTHLPGNLFGCHPRPTAGLRREFERAGLSQAWLFTVDGLIKDTNRNNDVLARAVAKDRDFFIPFCTVNPHDGEKAALKELDRCHSKLGMKGVKLHPWLQAFSMTHPAVLPIFRRAGELGMPVALHDGTPPYCDPLQIAAVAGKAPRTTVVLGHAGLDDLYADAILACLRQPNIHLCLCGPSCGHLEKIVRRCPAERLLFGSDGGLGGGIIEWRLDKVRQAIGDKRILEQVLFRNPARLIAALPKTR